MPPEDLQRVSVTIEFHDTQAVELEGWSCRAEGGAEVACTLEAAAIRVPEVPSLGLGVLLIATLASQRLRRRRRS